MKFTIIILFVTTNQLSCKNGYKNGCHRVAGCCSCGLRNEQEIKGDIACKNSEDPHKPTNDRIVGGCDAGGIIPWYVLLDLKTPGKMDSPKCGGVLINRLWIVTAAHCFTGTHGTMERNKEGLWTERMPLNQSANIYIGIDKHMESAATDINKPLSSIPYLIRELKVHPKYKRMGDNNTYGYERSDYDIALILLDYPVAGNERDPDEKIGRHLKFDRKIIMPVCLPTRQYKDVERQVMAAGMGITATRQKNCYTNEKGPEMFTKCARRFRYANANQKDDVGEWENAFEKSVKMPCVKSTNSIPSSKLDPLCNKFRMNHIKALEKKKSSGKPLSKEDQVKLNLTSDEAILIAKGRNLSYCFPTEFPAPSTGWCGTCVASATKNTPGYCAEGKDPTNDETAIVHQDKGWGFCDISCSTNMHIYTSTVKKVQLSTFNETFCSKIGTRVNASLLWVKEDDPYIVNSRIELCAGHINKLETNSFKYDEKNEDFKLMEKGHSDYKQTNEASSGHKKNKNLFRSIRLTNNPNLPNNELAEKGYVMGGEDTCSGDSGGPMYAMDPEDENVDKMKQKATLIGIVSRGSGCAQKNYPGIYTRIKKHLGYIFKTMKNSGEKGIHTYIRRGPGQDSFSSNNKIKSGATIKVSPYCQKIKKHKTNRRGEKKKKKRKKKKKNKERKKRRKTSKHKKKATPRWSERGS